MKVLFFVSVLMFLSACTIYTEKRSESLSQAVAATADSIEFARFDLATKYSKEAERIAYPPKKRIEINPIITKDVSSIQIQNTQTPVQINNKKTLINSNIVKTNDKNGNETSVLRLVIPEHLKHAKLLIQNSEEWNNLIKTKDFAEQLEKDNLNLKKLASEIDEELHKQLKMNNKMVEDLNKLQKQIVEKNLHILKLYIIIGLLLSTIGGGIYLRMKGIL
jgi:hypothetical protein